MTIEPTSLECKFCRQPIYETEVTPGYLGRPIHMRGKWRHVRWDRWACVPALIQPDSEKPRCHICGVEGEPHNGFCSAGGAPPHAAMPLDYEQKRAFGE